MFVEAARRFFSLDDLAASLSGIEGEEINASDPLVSVKSSAVAQERETGPDDKPLGDSQPNF